MTLQLESEMEKEFRVKGIVYVFWDHFKSIPHEILCQEQRYALLFDAFDFCHIFPICGNGSKRGKL
tara:strand:- start:197 stop:394 length:198 start_codon:yes stop_codon:yes gene_type:complete